jgi:RNA polymerase sigma-70 factor, ECF subfamily
VPYPLHTLARRLLENDPEALGEVLRWISAALTSPRFWSLRGEWPDLVQEVLTRLVESLRLERFDASRDFRVYVQGIARFVSLQALSRRPQTPPAADQPALREGVETGPETKVIERQLVRRVLDLASEDCRELFRLYFFEARSYQEIAGSLEVPVGTVKSRLFRCLESAHQIILTSALPDQGPPRLAREPTVARLEYRERDRE